MTSHVGRLYSLAFALVVFFLAWAVVAARPWAAATKPDPRAKALVVRANRLRHEAVILDRLLLAQQRTRATAAATPAPAPRVRIVTLPPITITRSS